MEKQSLFGEMSLKFSAHPENVATEALLYILKQHKEAWPALHRHFLRTGIDLPIDVIFRSQAWGEDQSQPDLIATDKDGVPVLIIEAKFWAGLTPNQPVTYLRRLVFNKPGILCFLCPGMRLSTLFGKLDNRCNASGIHLESPLELDVEYRSARLNSSHALCVISWGAVMSVLIREAETLGNNMLLGDTNQLDGLCSHMDSEAFLPLHPQDVSSDIGRRVQHFASLVDSVVYEFADNHGADIAGLSTGGSQSDYGRYFKLNEFGMFLKYSPRLWSRYGETPIWIEVKEVTEEGWSITHRVIDGINQLPQGRFRRIPETESKNTIGLELLLGVEKPDVIADVIKQIQQVVECCRRSESIASVETDSK